MAISALKLLKLIKVAPSFKTFIITLFTKKRKSSIRDIEKLDLPQGLGMKVVMRVQKCHTAI